LEGGAKDLLDSLEPGLISCVDDEDGAMDLKREGDIQHPDTTSAK
jgi:hypothetical protein